MPMRDAAVDLRGWLDRQRPATLLLGALALWALLFAVLALAGFGRHVALHEDDPALVNPLPAPALNRSRERLGPRDRYLAATARPLFNAGRKPAPVQLPADAQDQPFDVILTGIILTEGLQMAIVQDVASKASIGVRLEQPLPSAPGWRLVALAPRSAIFEGPSGRTTLEQRVFDGSGGEAPTATGKDGMAEDTMEPSPAAASAASGDAAEPAPETPEEQVEAIRRRIEARRAQLRQQQQSSDAVPPGQKDQ